MKQLAQVPHALPPLVAALCDAIRAGGTCALDRSVPAAIWRAALVDPAAEFLSRPGKELRAMIVRAGWALGGGAPGALPERLPLAIELLHAGSLIIDDVEDGSTTRRGAPTLHELVGVPLAVNTGSWMYFWALAELAQVPALADANALVVQTLVRCHHGQALDLATRVTDLDPAHVPAVVDAITRLKTGALCKLAIELAAHAAGAGPEVCAAVGQLGEAMGTALQMLDDLGSLVAPARRAKGHEDLRHARTTWPWAWLVEQDPFTFTRLVEYTNVRGDLDALADELGAEVATVGRARARAVLARGFETLIAVTGETPAAHALAAELRRLEVSYG